MIFWKALILTLWIMYVLVILVAMSTPYAYKKRSHFWFDLLVPFGTLIRSIVKNYKNIK